MKQVMVVVFGIFFLMTEASSQTSNNKNQVSLEERLALMIEGDRTGVCMAVATIGLNGEGQIEKAIACADQVMQKKRALKFDTAFEIGSISKVMTANILTGLIRDTTLSLDTPLSAILPKDVLVPSHNDQPIRLRHIVTHSSGLPPLPNDMHNADVNDPYSELTATMLFDSLRSVSLTRAPGAVFEYSNYAMMLLSVGLAHTSGMSFEQLLSKYVSDPSNMQDTFTSKPSKGTTLAKGHSQFGKVASHWHFIDNAHGVGGVRASLNDMINYAKANLGLMGAELGAFFQLAHQEQLAPSGQSVGMNWLRVNMDEEMWLLHEGGTGGFSSSIMLQPDRQLAVIILADTAMTSLGGVGQYAMALVNAEYPQPKPRTIVPAPRALLEDLAGEYHLAEFGLGMRVWHKGGHLYAQASGQSPFKLLYDSAGHFFPTKFDALLKPTKTSTGQTFEWSQGGSVTTAKRSGIENEQYVVEEKILKDYVGVYPLFSGFSLTVTQEGAVLNVQGSGQPKFQVLPVAPDEFSFDQVGAYFIFNRDESNLVKSITLKQGGQTLNGERHALTN